MSEFVCFGRRQWVFFLGYGIDDEGGRERRGGKREEGQQQKQEQEQEQEQGQAQQGQAQEEREKEGQGFVEGESRGKWRWRETDKCLVEICWEIVSYE